MASWVAACRLAYRLERISYENAGMFATSAARFARFLTSSAMTAKPAPASPARAASTAAFMARRLVLATIFMP